MIDKLKEEFKSQIDEADWSMLKDHHANGAVFIVDEQLNLVDVGVGIALDKAQIIKLWLDDGLLYRPGEELVSSLSKDEYKMCADFIIIQPYVLVRLKPEFPKLS